MALVPADGVGQCEVAGMPAWVPRVPIATVLMVRIVAMVVASFQNDQIFRDDPEGKGKRLVDDAFSQVDNSAPQVDDVRSDPSATSYSGVDRLGTVCLSEDIYDKAASSRSQYKTIEDNVLTRLTVAAL